MSTVDAATQQAGLAEQATRLWPLLKKRAQKRKTLSYAEAGLELELAADDAHGAAYPIHAWCWMHGMPPLNIVMVRRGKTPEPGGGFDQADYDAFHDALGHPVDDLEHAWRYPWEKVPDPAPEQLEHAVEARRKHADAITRLRFLDLELELRERDEARGSKRPVPQGHRTWEDVAAAHRQALAELGAAGLRMADLRPPGKGPYPPPKPAANRWDD